MMRHAIKKTLINLGLSTENSFKKFHPHVRDRKDIAVFKCEKSGVIALSRIDHINMTHYVGKNTFEYLPKRFVKGRSQIKKISYRDDTRRAEQFRDTITNKRWLDIGTGAGGILDILSTCAMKTYAVEPQGNLRAELQNVGYEVFPAIKKVKTEIDVVTLFHVFEHFTDPMGALLDIKKLLRREGKIIIEVPHANDFLISHLDLKAFKDFTFWSEHLILHTRESLRAFLCHAGYRNIQISGYQRFPLANHLYWLKEGKPGGHVKWGLFSNRKIDDAYADFLRGLNATDTLIATAEK